MLKEQTNWVYFVLGGDFMFDTLLLELDKSKRENPENSLEIQYMEFIEDFKKYKESLKEENIKEKEDEEVYAVRVEDNGN